MKCIKWFPLQESFTCLVIHLTTWVSSFVLSTVGTADVHRITAHSALNLSEILRRLTSSWKRTTNHKKFDSTSRLEAETYSSGELKCMTSRTNKQTNKQSNVSHKQTKTQKSKLSWTLIWFFSSSSIGNRFMRTEAEPLDGKNIKKLKKTRLILKKSSFFVKAATFRGTFFKKLFNFSDRRRASLMFVDQTLSCRKSVEKPD